LEGKGLPFGICFVGCDYGLEDFIEVMDEGGFDELGCELKAISRNPEHGMAC